MENIPSKTRFLQLCYRDEGGDHYSRPMIVSDAPEFDLHALVLAVGAPSAPTDDQASKVAALLVASFPTTNCADVRAYMRQVFEVVRTYPAFVVAEIANAALPLSIIRQTKFLPSLLEISEWADARLDAYRKAAEQAKRMLDTAGKVEAAKADPKLLRIEETVGAEVRVIFEREKANG